MVESIGIDIVELNRIAKAFDRHGERFAAKILSINERQALNARRDSAAYLAGRFAAKEAVMKALGEYFDSGVRLKDIEILNDKAGRPFVQLPEQLQQVLGKRKILLSISHSRANAVAVATIGS